ncbi:MAG: lamin tail domain-containing protein [Sedimentisphaerales bacterium]|nr:lamin tail domain-containing protein [Sedimentisphaerales bacterium]
MRVEPLENRVLLSVIDSLRITELMYNPADPPAGSTFGNDQFEFIELKNIGAETISLTGVKFQQKDYSDPGEPVDMQGINFDFTGSAVTSLAPGQFVLVVRNTAAFQERYGTGLNSRIAGQYGSTNPALDDKLSNDGEHLLLLYDPAGGTEEVIQEFKYNDSWYPVTDGIGFSLQIIDPLEDDLDEWDSPDGWRPSGAMHGTPGQDDVVSRQVIISELLAHSHATEPDWIEFYNPNDTPVDIGHWYLSDSNLKPDLDDPDPGQWDYGYTKFVIPAGSIIPAHGYLVLDENTHFGVAGNFGANQPFQFSDDGEGVYLSSANAAGTLTGYFEQREFGASETGVSFGRYEKSTDTYNFVAMAEPTPGQPNSDPKVGPVVISEIMYNPAPGDLASQELEYIELTNITALPVILQDFDVESGVTSPWKFTQGIDYTFPLATTIPAYGTLIVAKNPAAFTAHYGVIPGVQVLGPFANDTNLSNNGEKLDLAKAGEIPTEDQNGDGVINELDRVYIRLERVNYDDKAPWPTAADGQGKALVRIDNTQYGNDPVNWTVADPLNTAPVITAFTVQPDPATQGSPLTLTATVVDDGDVVSRVEFYRDTNDNGVWEAGLDTLLAVDTNGGDGWSWTGLITPSELGTQRYFARAQDDDLFWSPTAIVAGLVNAAPTIGSLTAEPDPVVRPGTLTLTAHDVADADGTILQVEFYLDADQDQQFDAAADTLLGVDNFGDDGWIWSGATGSFATGEQWFFARAKDTQAGVSAAAGVSITVADPNIPPTIGSLLDQPDPVTQGQMLTLTAGGVQDTDGTVVRVEFYHDLNASGSLEVDLDILLGTDTNGLDGWNYAFDSASLPGGANGYFARAQDDGGDWSATVECQGFVISANAAPTIGSLDAGPDPVKQGQTLTLTAQQVQDTDGTVVQVEFYRDANHNGVLDVTVDTVLGVDTDPNGGWSWSGATTGFDLGANRYFARARDDGGGWSAAAAATGQIDPANIPPTIGSVTDAPDPVNLGSTLTLTALNVADTDGTVVQVEFYHDSNQNGTLDVGSDSLLGVDTQGQDGWSWTGSTAGLTVGSHRYLARAVDNESAVGNVVETTGEVLLLNAPPTIDTLEHDPNPVFQGGQFSLRAEGVSDPDGTVERVEFYRDNGDGFWQDGAEILLGVDADSGGGWSWTADSGSLALGDYVYFARAQDDQSSWSDPAAVTATVEQFFVLAELGVVNKVVYADGDDSQVTVNLKNCTARLFFDTADPDVVQNKSTLTINGNGDLVRIELVQAGPGAQIKIAAKGGSDGLAELGGIVGESLDALAAKTVNLTGPIDLDGALGTVQLHDILDGVSVTADQSAAKGFSLKANQIGSDVIFELAGRVASFQAVRYESGLLQADSVGKVKIASDDFGASIKALTGGIDGVQTAGNITGRLIAGIDIGKVKSKLGGFLGAARAGDTIGLIQVLNLDGAVLSAGGTIQKVSVKQDVVDSYIMGGYDIGTDGAFGVQEAGGGDWLGNGQVNQVIVKGMFSESYITAGVEPPIYPDGAVPSPSVPEPVDSGVIGKIKFGGVDLQNAENIFGLFAKTEINPFKIGKQLAQTEGLFHVDAGI